MREGNARLSGGDPTGALRRYDEAERAAGKHAEIDHDRGVALYRMGRGPEAREAWRRAAEGAGSPPALASRARQNIGTALAAEGDRAGAIAALVEALRSDPRNEDARYDLEVLLRQEQAEKDRRQQQAQQDQQQGQGQQDGQKDEQQDQGRQDRRKGGQQARGQQDEGERRQDQQRGERQREQPQRAQQGGPGERERAEEPAADPARSGQPGADAPLTREQAARILDAFRSREQLAPPGAERRRDRRADAERDW